jgi:hypothetical protein
MSIPRTTADERRMGEGKYVCACGKLKLPEREECFLCEAATEGYDLILKEPTPRECIEIIVARCSGSIK